LFRPRITDFLSTTVKPSYEKEGDKKERKQEKRGQRREIQGSRWCTCSMYRGVPPPLHEPYLSGQVREAQRRVPLLPPSTHLQLLQFPEAAEDLHDGLQMEVKSRKADIGQL
jgi:hypothetical protein